MLTVHITDDTKPAMLRAIRAACNELLGETHTDLTTQAAEHNSRAVALHAAAEAESDKAAAALTVHNYAQGGEVSGGHMYRVGEQPSEQTVLASHATPITLIEAVEDNRQDRVPAILVDEELDSAGQPWNAELHSSSRAKVADGTWKKRRGAAQAATETIAQDDAATLVPMQSAPPVPPAPTDSAEPIMPKIFALITSQIVTINQAVEAAQAEGFADLGANGLGGAPREAQEAVLRKLEAA